MKTFILFFSLLSITSSANAFQMNCTGHLNQLKNSVVTESETLNESIHLVPHDQDKGLTILMQTSGYALNAMVNDQGSVILRLIDLAKSNGYAEGYEEGVIATSVDDNSIYLSLSLNKVDFKISCKKN